MIKIDIITGFLGSGKTTFINRLLKEGYSAYNPVLVENEFGEMPIDGDLIDTNLRMYEMASGCICCTLSDNFIEGIVTLAKSYHPDRILIEPTGAANLEDVLRACGNACTKIDAAINSIITIVSAESLIPLTEIGGDFFQEQLEQARVIYLSCTDLVGKEDIDDCIAIIRKHNPEAIIFSGNISLLTLLSEAEEALTAEDTNCYYRTILYEPMKPRNRKKTRLVLPSKRNKFESCSFTPKKYYTKEGVFHLLEAIMNDDSLGTVYRAKGFLLTDPAATAETDFYLAECELRGHSQVSERVYQGEPKFIVIGKQLKQDKLEQLFTNYASHNL
ncbi:MAG: GTP-binding protein [Lachnospiraceae bacterium]|nr:GTP-binding protein [Lachnospiraceae bacterium]